MSVNEGDHHRTIKTIKCCYLMKSKSPTLIMRLYVGILKVHFYVMFRISFFNLLGSRVGKNSFVSFSNQKNRRH